MANLRYREARNTADLLGQVFTPKPIAKLLARSISIDREPIRYVLDLGAGGGILAAAILERHKRAKAVLVEIDAAYASVLRTIMPSRAEVIQADALGYDWKCEKCPDVIISNPPYGTIAASAEVKNMLRLTDLNIPNSGGWIRNDVAFIARAWDIAKAGCTLGLIVASPMIRDSAYRDLRSVFISRLDGLCVTQLDESTFQNTEVRAFLITGKRTISRRRNVILRKALSDGTIVDEMEVSYKAAIHSLDIGYHRSLERLGITANNNIETLDSIGATIARGSRSQRDYQRLGMIAFHTTNFSEITDEVVLSGASGNFQVARSGDILIPRVGTRCLTRQAKVLHGVGLFTDCVYRLSIKPSERDRVWRTLTSSFGYDWRLANAGGSCAKHLTVQTLINMPILI